MVKIGSSTSTTQSSNSQQQSKSSRRSSGGNKGGVFKFVFIVLILALIGGSVYWFFLRTPKMSDYSAVFLSNGQVYFGKLKRSPGGATVLTDVYYLILRRPLQQQTSQATPSAQQQPEYTLVKLGKEMHGPEDEMKINDRHILFIEGLKQDGKVVQAIKQFKEQGK